MWCIPKQQSHPFVAGMERVLKVYQRSYDPRHPVVCMDEMSKQSSWRKSASSCRYAPGRRRSTTLTTSAGENARCGCSTSRYPVGGRWPSPNGARRWIGRSKCARWRICHVIGMRKPSRWCACDNLNTHSGDSFYAAFPAAEASRLNDRIHLVHTPKHGSWLNVAELEFSALHRQCLDRRIESRALRHVGNGGLGQGAQSRTDRGRLAAQRRRRAH